MSLNVTSGRDRQIALSLILDVYLGSIQSAWDRKFCRFNDCLDGKLCLPRNSTLNLDLKNLHKIYRVHQSIENTLGTS